MLLVAVDLSVAGAVAPTLTAWAVALVAASSWEAAPALPLAVLVLPFLFQKD